MKKNREGGERETVYNMSVAVIKERLKRVKKRSGRGGGGESDRDAEERLRTGRVD